MLIFVFSISKSPVLIVEELLIMLPDKIRSPSKVNCPLIEVLLDTSKLFRVASPDVSRVRVSVLF